MRFTKWQGLGNDFVMCQAEEISLEEGGKLAQHLCAPHWGVGADGLIYALPSRDGAAQLTMEIFNADGTVAQMCGNGIRCLAAWAVQQGWVTEPRFSIATRSGIKTVAVTREGCASGWQVEVDMGMPQILATSVSEEKLGEEFVSYLVSMGNLHRVVMHCDSTEAPGWLSSLDVDKWGRELEASAHGDCNVEFISAPSAQELWVRVRERGVGETLACGTGACASLVAASLQGICPRQASVHLPGGVLSIRWEEDGHVYMCGPAREVFVGEIKLD